MINMRNAVILLASINVSCFQSFQPVRIWTDKATSKTINVRGGRWSNVQGRIFARESVVPRSLATIPVLEGTRGTITAVRDDEIEQQAQLTAKSAAIGLRYDPLEADRYWSSRTLQVWKRDMEISVPITAFLGKVLIDYQQGVEERNRQMRAREFMSIIASLGPAFIKAGQVRTFFNLAVEQRPIISHGSIISSKLFLFLPSSPPSLSSLLSSSFLFSSLLSFTCLAACFLPFHSLSRTMKYLSACRLTLFFVLLSVPLPPLASPLASLFFPPFPPPILRNAHAGSILPPRPAASRVPHRAAEAPGHGCESYIYIYIYILIVNMI
jgi:hypothetical protein